MGWFWEPGNNSFVLLLCRKSLWSIELWLLGCDVVLRWLHHHPLSDTEPFDAALRVVYLPPAVPQDPWSSMGSNVLLCALQHRSPLLQHRADERDAGWICAAAVSPHAGPPLVLPHAGSSVLQALLCTCLVSGRWGSTEALGMTQEALCVWEIALLRSGCLLKSCFNSIP